MIHFTHTHPFNGPFPGLSRWAGTRKVKPIWILLKQETMSCSGISWTICKSAPRSRQITMPAPHQSVFLQAGCPSCHITNSVKALKELVICFNKDKIKNNNSFLKLQSNTSQCQLFTQPPCCVHQPNEVMNVLAEPTAQVPLGCTHLHSSSNQSYHQLCSYSHTHTPV